MPSPRRDWLSTTYPRRFVPAEADLGDWPEIEVLIDRLDARAIDTPTELEAWLLDWSELSACLGEEESRRYIAMTCQTDDPEREKAYMHFVEELSPRIKPRFFTLKQKYMGIACRRDLP